MKGLRVARIDNCVIGSREFTAPRYRHSELYVAFIERGRWGAVLFRRIMVLEIDYNVMLVNGFAVISNREILVRDGVAALFFY